MAGPRPLAQMVPQVAGTALGKRGLAFGPLMTDWPSIVGPHLAERTQPDKLTFPRGAKENATLSVRVVSAFALEVQHLEPLIVERINSFFGYHAVARLKLIPGPPSLSALRKAPTLRHLSPDEEKRVDYAVSAVEDEALRETLSRFGRTLLARRRK